MSSKCFCGMPRNYAECCGAIIDAKRLAVSAEELMRARYSSYVNGRIDFLERSQSFLSDTDFNPVESQKWSANSTWIRLEIIKLENGHYDESEGIVEFKAIFKFKESYLPELVEDINTLSNENREYLLSEQCHHERARFVKEHGAWKYQDGTIIGEGSFKLPIPLVGRNDACPCGSGKKYKKCCLEK